MRKFSSYGPISVNSDYYVPRSDLIESILAQLAGERPEEGGHYITIWAPRQRGKTWIMQQVMQRIQADPAYRWLQVVKLNLQDLEQVKDENRAAKVVAGRLLSELNLQLEAPHTIPETLDDFHHIFTKQVLARPLILILDEFDSLRQDAIAGITRVFRNIYISRRDEGNRPSAEKSYLLHGVALVGVCSVLGVDNESGSPFNVQRSVQIPNLTYAEVNELYRWYERESGQVVEQAVIDRLFYEVEGQPGLTCWFGELLTEKFNTTPDQPITLANFATVYREALNVLPNSNIINIVSKARRGPYKEVVLDLFQTERKVPFEFDNPYLNYLYLNGVIDMSRAGSEVHVRFANPFVQRRLFKALSSDFFSSLGRLHDPFADLSDTITQEHLNVKNLLRRYEVYLKRNHKRILHDQIPRRKSDLRVYEAIFHFHLYKYLVEFLENKRGEVIPEFPTGNGKIDLIIRYADVIYGLEVKSFADQFAYQEALEQAARYAQQMRLPQIWLAFFVEAIDDTNRQRFEHPYQDRATGVNVEPVFITTLPNDGQS